MPRLGVDHRSAFVTGNADAQPLATLDPIFKPAKRAWPLVMCARPTRNHQRRCLHAERQAI